MNIKYTSDEASIGIKYRASADWPTLGKKLRKDIGKVRSALPNITSKECKDFVRQGKKEVNGVSLVMGDLIITRYVESVDEESKDSATATDQDVIIILDVRRHADLESMAILRALTSRVNKLRKEAGMKATDKVDIFYDFDNGEEDVLGPALREHEDFLVRQIGGVPMELGQAGEGRKMIAVEKRTKEAMDLNSEERFVLSLADRQ